MTDVQGRAFTDADPETWAQQAVLLEGAVIHEPGDTDGIKSPQEWAGWDSERQQPKTVEEAQVALKARILDDRAPDGAEVGGIYDGLED